MTATLKEPSTQDQIDELLREADIFFGDGADDNLAKLEALLQTRKAEISTDVSTEAKRKEIVRAANAVRKIRTGLEGHAKEMTKELRDQIAVVNGAASKITETVQPFIDDIRAPVTQWEEKEEQRKAQADQIIQDLRNAKMMPLGSTIADIQTRIEQVRGKNFTADVMGDRMEMAEELHELALHSLEKDLAAAQEIRRQRIEQQEAARKAELEAQRLHDEQLAAERKRKAEAEKAEQERLAQIAEAKAKAEVERAEKEALQRKLDEMQAREDARLLAEQQAEAEAKAEAERAEQDKAKAAKPEPVTEIAPEPEPVPDAANDVAAQEPAPERQSDDDAAEGVSFCEAVVAISYVIIHSKVGPNEAAYSIVQAIEKGMIPHITFTPSTTPKGE